MMHTWHNPDNIPAGEQVVSDRRLPDLHDYRSGRILRSVATREALGQSEDCPRTRYSVLSNGEAMVGPRL